MYLLAGQSFMPYLTALLISSFAPALFSVIHTLVARGQCILEQTLLTTEEEAFPDGGNFDRLQKNQSKHCPKLEFFSTLAS